MRLYFRPFLGLTVFTIISLVILVGLGTWQYQRLQWKTSFLQEVETAVTSAPLTSIEDVEAALEQSRPVDFRRIGLQANIIEGQTPFLVYSREKTVLSWRPFLAVEQSGRAVFAAFKPIPDSERDSIPFSVAETVTLAGYIRLARDAGKGVAKSTAETNRWFSFNPMPDSANWSDRIPGGADMRFYIDVEPSIMSAKDLPLKRPNIRNNHFDYMLTWYGLAIALFIIYLILHAQRGRLSWKDNA